MLIVFLRERIESERGKEERGAERTKKTAHLDVDAAHLGVDLERHVGRVLQAPAHLRPAPHAGLARDDALARDAEQRVGRLLDLAVELRLARGQDDEQDLGAVVVVVVVCG